MQNEESKAIIANYWQSVEDFIVPYLSTPNCGFLITPAHLEHRMMSAPSYLQLQTTLVDVEIRNLVNGENNLFHFALPPHHHEWVSMNGPYGSNSLETKTFDFIQSCIYMRRLILSSNPTSVLWIIKYNPETQEWATIKKFTLGAIANAISVSQWPYSI